MELWYAWHCRVACCCGSLWPWKTQWQAEQTDGKETGLQYIPQDWLTESKCGGV